MDLGKKVEFPFQNIPHGVTGHLFNVPPGAENLLPGSGNDDHPHLPVILGRL